MSDPADAEPSPGGGSGPSILLVAYFYPPCRDTGAQRPESMTRHLIALGYRVSVLTTSAYSGSVGEGPGELGEANVIRTADLQLLRARRAGKETVAALFDSDSYSGKPHPLAKLIVPEPLRLAWGPWALRRARRLDPLPDCVITTSPPETAHRIGLALQRRGVPWVADLRDGWTFEPLRPRFPTALQRRFDEALERRWLGSADVVTCVSGPVADDLRRRGIADPLIVPNGWDPARAPAAAGEAAAGDTDAAHLLDPERISLVYTGRFGSYGRDPRPLIEALARLAHADPEVAGRIELAIAGPLTAAERALFDRDVAPAHISALGSLDRPRALALQRAADALLLIAAPDRSQLANYKLFEYLAARRPILALAAGTEAGRISSEAGCEVVRSDDVDAIVAALDRLARGGLSPPAAEVIDSYTYPVPARLMSEAVELAIERRGGGGETR